MFLLCFFNCNFIIIAAGFCNKQTCWIVSVYREISEQQELPDCLLCVYSSEPTHPGVSQWLDCVPSVCVGSDVVSAASGLTITNYCSSGFISLIWFHQVWSDSRVQLQWRIRRINVLVAAALYNRKKLQFTYWNVIIFTWKCWTIMTPYSTAPALKLCFSATYYFVAEYIILLFIVPFT